jgi:hypothetical protein
MYLCTCLQYLLHFLLAAAAVQCTRSGDTSGEGFALNNFFYSSYGSDFVSFYAGKCRV